MASLKKHVASISARIKSKLSISKSFKQLPKQVFYSDEVAEGEIKVIYNTKTARAIFPSLFPTSASAAATTTTTSQTTTTTTQQHDPTFLLKVEKSSFAQDPVEFITKILVWSSALDIVAQIPSMITYLYKNSGRETFKALRIKYDFKSAQEISEMAVKLKEMHKVICGPDAAACGTVGESSTEEVKTPWEEAERSSTEEVKTPPGEAERAAASGTVKESSTGKVKKATVEAEGEEAEGEDAD